MDGTGTLEEQPYLATVVEAYDVGRPFTPGLAQWLELFIGLAEGLSAAMSEQKSPQDALNDVAANWTTVIAQAPPDWEYKEVKFEGWALHPTPSLPVLRRGNG